MTQMTPEHAETAASAVRVAGAWAAVSIGSWSDIASALAALLSFLLICEWIWKRFVRKRNGGRRTTDTTSPTDLDTRP